MANDDLKISSLSINRTTFSEKVIFEFEGTLHEAALLRRSFLTQIPTKSIDIVVFDKNITSMTPEMIAARLGLLVIDNEKLDPAMVNTLIPFKFSFPPSHTDPLVEITTDDLRKVKDIPFVYMNSNDPIPILTMRPGEELEFSIIIKENIGNNHVKFRPVSVVNFNDFENIPSDTNSDLKKIRFTFENLGMFRAKELINLAWKYRKVSSSLPPQTIYDKL